MNRFDRPQHFTAPKEKSYVAPHLGRDGRFGILKLKTQLTIDGIDQKPVVNGTEYQEGFEVHDSDLAATVRGNGIVAGLSGKKRARFYDGLGREVIITHGPNK